MIYMMVITTPEAEAKEHIGSMALWPAPRKRIAAVMRAEDLSSNAISEVAVGAPVGKVRLLATELSTGGLPWTSPRRTYASKFGVETA